MNRQARRQFLSSAMLAGAALAFPALSSVAEAVKKPKPKPKLPAKPISRKSVRPRT